MSKLQNTLKVRKQNGESPTIIFWKRSANLDPILKVAPTNSYISILRKSKKFAILQVTSDRFDIGIKLKGMKATDRFESAGTWNAMVTHRVQISEPKQIDKEVLAWLKQAYEAA